jgi:hypothetical protein
MKALPQSAIESRFGAEPTKGYICTLLFCAVTKRQSKHFLEYHKGLLNPATKGYESTAKRATESCHKGIYFHVPAKTTHTTMSITRQMHIIFTNSIESNNIQAHPN